MGSEMCIRDRPTTPAFCCVSYELICSQSRGVNTSTPDCPKAPSATRVKSLVPPAFPGQVRHCLLWYPMHVAKVPDATPDSVDEVRIGQFHPNPLYVEPGQYSAVYQYSTLRQRSPQCGTPIQYGRGHYSSVRHSGTVEVNTVWSLVYTTTVQ